MGEVVDPFSKFTTIEIIPGTQLKITCKICGDVVYDVSDKSISRAELSAETKRMAFHFELHHEIRLVDKSAPDPCKNKKH
jgi:hypothetical protein